MNFLGGIQEIINSGGTPNIDNLASQLGNVSDEAVKFAKNTDIANINLDSLTTSSKAASFGIQALAMAGNMLLFMAISKGIQLAVKAIDNWIHRVERADEAMQTAVSEYDTAKSKLENTNAELDKQTQVMDELLSKDNLSYVEQGQLEELKAITKELLLQQEIESNSTEQAAKEAASKTVNAYEKKYGKFDIDKETVEENINFEISPIPQNENDIPAMIAGYVRDTKLLEEARKNYKEAVANGSEQGELNWLKEDIQYQIDTIEDFENSLSNNLSDLQNKKLALQDGYKEAIEKRAEVGFDSLTTDEKETISTYEKISNAIKLIYEYTDPSAWNAIEISNIFNTEGIEKTKDELIAMAQSGKLTPETIDSYSNLNTAINNSEMFLKDGQTAAEAFCNELSSIADKTKDIEILDSSTFSSTLAKIESLSKGLDQLSEIYTDILDGGNFNWSSILNNEDFKNTFGNLGSAYEEFIKTVSNSPNDINACQSAFDNLTTTYLNNCEGMKNVTAETRDATIAFLEQKGIVNADEFVDAAIRYNETSKALKNLTAETRNETIALLERNGVANATELVDREIAYQKEKLKFSTEEFADSAQDEIMAMYNSATATEAEKQALAQLWLEKLNFNNCKINTSDDINQIIAMANAAGAGI